MIRWNVSQAEWNAAEPIRRWVRESDKCLGIALTQAEIRELPMIFKMDDWMFTAAPQDRRVSIDITGFGGAK